MKNTARLITFCLSFLLFFFIFLSDSHAENGRTYQVSTSSLNVRSTPSHSGEIIGRLNKGDKIVAFQEKHGWILTYYDGKEVWVASQFLAPAEGKTQSNDPNHVQQQQTNTVQVMENDVHIRSGAGTNHSIIGTANAGDTYNLKDTSGDWHQIALSGGSTGWIAAWLTNAQTSSEQEQDTKTNSSNEEKSPSGEGTVASNGSLEGINIMLDPGHGGKDPGSIGVNRAPEKDLTLSITDRIAQSLRNAGATVIVTRTSDHYLSLDQRVDLSHSYNTHAFISLHYNAFPIETIRGFSTFYSSDRELANEIHSSIMQNINMQDRGVNQADFHVMRENNNPAILLELGFITNPDDLLMIQSGDYQNGLANGITNGLKNYFNSY